MYLRRWWVLVIESRVLFGVKLVLIGMLGNILVSSLLFGCDIMVLVVVMMNWLNLVGVIFRVCCIVWVLLWVLM